MKLMIISDGSNIPVLIPRHEVRVPEWIININKGLSACIRPKIYSIKKMSEAEESRLPFRRKELPLVINLLIRKEIPAKLPAIRII